MQKHRQIVLERQVQLGRVKALLLVAPWVFGKLRNEKIQAYLADSDEARVVERRLDVAFETLQVIFGGVLDADGMDAQGVTSSLERMSQVAHRLEVAHINGRNNNSRHALPSATLDDCLPIGIEVTGIQMAMGIN